MVPSLSSLVGAHPDALLEIYGAGRPADPAELGDAPRGRILAVGSGAQLFLLGRPLVRALATDRLPWKGITFDHGGASGQNVIFERNTLRFQADLGPSRLDGRPSLVLTYASPAYRNPWPFRALTDELRLIGDSVAIGPSFFQDSDKPFLWLGIGMV